jgi:hypothetical protein
MPKFSSSQGFGFYEGPGVGDKPDGPTEYTNASMLFLQSSAPTGWTKVTTYNDYSLRIVSDVASTGGTVAFSTAFVSVPVTGTISNATFDIGPFAMTNNELPAHAHSYYQYNGSTQTVTGGSNVTILFNPSPVASALSGTTPANPIHTHTQPTANCSTFLGTSLNMAVKYVDSIIATYTI